MFGIRLSFWKELSQFQEEFENIKESVNRKNVIQHNGQNKKANKDKLRSTKHYTEN